MIGALGAMCLNRPPMVILTVIALVLQNNKEK